MSDSGCKNVMFLSIFFSFFFERDGFCQLIMKKNQIKKHINVCLCDRRERGREGGRGSGGEIGGKEAACHIVKVVL